MLACLCSLVAVCSLSSESLPPVGVWCVHLLTETFILLLLIVNMQVPWPCLAALNRISAIHLHDMYAKLWL